MKRKAISILLSLVLAVGMIPAFVVTAGAYTPGSIAGATGSGTESDPLVVTTLPQLKAALESKDDELYIRMDEFENTPYLSYYVLEGGVDYESGNVAIRIPYGITKHLELNATVDLRAIKDDPLLYSLIYNQGWLFLSGTGTIRGSFNSSGYPNSIIYNYGGMVQISGDIYLDASQRAWATHGYALTNARGTMIIEGGKFFGANTRKGATGDISALFCVEESDTTIFGGTFSAYDNTDNGNDAWGLMMLRDGNVSVTLKGGEFQGITGNASLDSYVAEGYKMLKADNGSEIDTSKTKTKETVVVTDGSSSTEYSIKTSAGTADKTAAKKDETVKLTAIPGGSDFTFDGWKVVSGGASVADRTAASTTFTMPDSDVKISGSYKINAGSGGNSWSGKTNPFVDVSEGAYYYDPVLWAYYSDPQVTNGMDATHFGPSSTVTRGQCVAFLWRAMGEPEPTTKTNPFTDVPEWQYYYKPILWAVEQGVTKGTSATTFSPDQKLSTAHIITFLYRTLGKGSDGWYEEAGNWAKGDGLLDGTGLGVSDQTDCPRGAVVTFLYRELADTASGVNELSKNDFLMYVEESYNITGRGRVVSGKVQNGSIRTGDKVTLISCDESTKAPVRTTYTVEGIEMFHKLLDEAEKGDNVGILLSAATGTNTPPGSALVNEGSPLKSSPGRFVGTFKRNSDHATKTLTLGDTFQVYWSGYDVTAMLVDLNGGDITPDTTREGVKLTLISPAVFYVGQELTIREGGRTYGTFTVTGIE